MDTPQQLLFTRTIEGVVPFPLDMCIQSIHQFKTTLTAPIHVTVNTEQFVICYGGQSQLQLWAFGTWSTLNETHTQIDVQVGIERGKTTFNLLAGLSGLVLMMILAEGLSQDVDGDGMLTAIIIFFGGFWLILIGGMAYSQHRLRQDLIHALGIK